MSSAPLTAPEAPPLGLPDILDFGLKVVFCGINPGMRSAKLGLQFAGRGNRFWQALYLSGFTPTQLLPQDAGSLLKYRCGLTSAVDRPTVGAKDLTRQDFIEARPQLERKIRHYHPRVIAFLGKPACSAIFNQSQLAWGRQSVSFGDAQVWVLPNPSALNFAFPLPRLVAAYRELFDEVGSRRLAASQINSSC